MKANCWISRNTVEVQDVPDPAILNRRDAIVKVTSSAICGSDLHLLDGYVPTMQSGDVVGHEFMGEVIEVGDGIGPDQLRVGDRVVVPFPIACGACWTCKTGLYSCCENTNPNASLAEKFFGHPTGGIFGYSHLTGGYAGGQAEYARVPFADVGPLKIETGLTDEQVLFLSDILPTGYMGAEMCDVVAVWGAGPVGQFAMDSARLLGADRVIAIDKEPYRLAMAEEAGHIPLDFTQVDVRSELLELTGGRGPDKCIDAVGMEATLSSRPINAYDRAKQATGVETERPHALRQAIMCCRNGGIVSVIGDYGGSADKFPAGSWMNRSLILRTGQCHVQRYMKPLLERIERGEIDPTRVITHTLPLQRAPHGYDIFKHKEDSCEKVVLKPGSCVAADARNGHRDR
jgi:threonine dehydrogenase-like Zn-dependent dehydrogenase